MKYNGSVIDSHLHMHGGYTDTVPFFAGMETLADKAGYTGKNLAMVPQWDKEFISQNQLGILYKALYPGKAFSYAGFDYYLPEGAAKKALAQQAREYWEMGFDGIKMVELKPTVYNNLGGPVLSGGQYDEMFRYLEDEGIPLLLHVGDPETFWNKETLPDFARENGWFYGGGDYPALEALYADTEEMLRRHPSLHVSLAHFYFLSAMLERATHIMESYPNVRLDLTPGVEMYGNFSQKPQEWRDFFCKYQDRILFGTDNGWGSTTPMQEKIDFAVENVGVIRRFLETDDAFEGYGMQLQGIDLPLDVLEKIYIRNFEAMAGKEPRPVNLQKALAYTEEMLDVYRGQDVPFYECAFPQMEFVQCKLKELLREG